MTDLIIDKRRRDLGGGFEVGRVLPFAKRRMVEPFIFFDQMGPADFAPVIPHELDVRPHPHIGLSTVTYRYSGAVNWITAGKGITPSERLEHARMHVAHMHGIQAWVACQTRTRRLLPASDTPRQAACRLGRKPASVDG